MYAPGFAEAERLIKRLMLREESTAAYSLLSRVLGHVQKSAMLEMLELCKDESGTVKDESGTVKDEL